MSYLSYIKDSELELIVKSVLDRGIEKKRKAEEEFTKNVIDPFGSLFDAAVFGINHKIWKNSEMIRQCQKTLQNHVGELHQQVLGSVDNWLNLGTGTVVDLVCKDKKIIAEIKNKHNTVTGSKLAGQYYSLDRLVMPKASQYRGYTAYFVNIIPKRSERLNSPFAPSDPDKGAKCAKNEMIRVIDGASFYSLVTGQDTALLDFYSNLPTIIENIFLKFYKKPDFKIPDKAEFSKYFGLAYGNNEIDIPTKE